jgi:hypothetical protein
LTSPARPDGYTITRSTNLFAASASAHFVFQPRKLGLCVLGCWSKFLLANFTVAQFDKHEADLAWQS